MCAVSRDFTHTWDVLLNWSAEADSWTEHLTERTASHDSVCVHGGVNESTSAQLEGMDLTERTNQSKYN